MILISVVELTKYSVCISQAVYNFHNIDLNDILEMI